MLIYWLMFSVAGVMALSRTRVPKIGWWTFGIILTTIIGLRFRVGGDWNGYLAYLLRSSQLTFTEVFTQSDPAYYLVNWISVQLGAGVWLVNCFGGAVFSIGLIRFCRRLPEPLVALAISIPYMVIVLAMGYSRQAIAFGFILWGLTYLLERKIFYFVFMLSIAAAFHKSAIILIPLAVLASVHNRVWTGLWVGITGVLLYWLFLAEKVDTLWDNYVDSEYASKSEGGAIRVAMNALPAVLFILYRKRMNMPQEERALWFWVSIFALVCMPLVFQAPTAVDRVALYFMPIQLVVGTYLLQIFSARERAMPRLGVVGLYALVMFVWLNYAANSRYWVPYNFWPII